MVKLLHNEPKINGIRLKINLAKLEDFTLK